VGLSLNEKSTLYALLTSWRGKAFTPEELKRFDLGKIAGKPAFINVTHSVKGDRTYANLTSIMPLPKAIPAPVLEGEALVYSTDAPDGVIFDKLPTWMQDKIAARIVDAPKAAAKKSVAAAEAEADVGSFADDDLSF
jgi:hypothetical protein